MKFPIDSGPNGESLGEVWGDPRSDTKPADTLCSSAGAIIMHLMDQFPDSEVWNDRKRMLEMLLDERSIRQIADDTGKTHLGVTRELNTAFSLMRFITRSSNGGLPINRHGQYVLPEDTSVFPIEVAQLPRISEQITVDDGLKPLESF